MKLLKVEKQKSKGESLTQDGKILLLTENRKPHTIMGWETEEKALDYFIESFTQTHIEGHLT